MPIRDNINMHTIRSYKVNLLNMLDIIQVLRENKALINPSEEDLSEPERTSRLILRRKIKEIFPSFTVRKNKYDYALRIDDEELYTNFQRQKTLYYATQYTNMISEEVIDEIKTCLGTEETAFRLMNQSYGIRHDVKGDGRLFVYFDFSLAGQNSGGRTNNNSVLSERSLKSVIDKVPLIKTSIDNKVELTGYVKKMYDLIQRFGMYIISGYNMELVTKEFLDYVDDYELNSSGRSGYRLMVNDYRDWKVQKEKEKENDIRETEERESSISLRNSENPQQDEDLQARFDAALRQVMANRED
jgi:hypothetical protein